MSVRRIEEVFTRKELILKWSARAYFFLGDNHLSRWSQRICLLTFIAVFRASRIIEGKAGKWKTAEENSENSRRKRENGHASRRARHAFAARYILSTAGRLIRGRRAQRSKQGKMPQSAQIFGKFPAYRTCRACSPCSG